MLETRLATVRVRSGLYISYDGLWKIERQPQYWPNSRQWRVYRLTDARWTVVTQFPTLARARAFIIQTINEAWF
jgi:hypothetical protein